MEVQTIIIRGVFLTAYIKLFWLVYLNLIQIAVFHMNNLSSL